MKKRQTLPLWVYFVNTMVITTSPLGGKISGLVLNIAVNLFIFVHNMRALYYNDQIEERELAEKERERRRQILDKR